MNRVTLAGLATIGAGVVAIVASGIGGGAHVYWIIVVPVLTGSSLTFLAGVALLIGGVLIVGLGGAATGAREPEPDEPPGPGSSVRSGGLVLIGPIPVFFGDARKVEDRYYWLAVAAGTALFVAVIALVYLG